MQPIDVGTTFLTGVVLNLIAACYLGNSWPRARAYPGVRLWGLAAISSTAGAALLALRPVLPLLLSAAGGTFALIAGYLFLLLGLQQFSGQPARPSRAALAITLATAAGILFFLLVQPDFGVRAVFSSAGTAWLAASAAWFCLRRLDPAYGSEARFLATILGLLAASRAARAVAALLAIHAGVDADLFDRGELEKAFLLLNTCSWAVALYALPSLQRRRLLIDLEQSNARVRKLEGILPICMYCKRIRDAGRAWQQLERYIRDRSEANFSHGICPDCFAEHHPDLPPPP